MVDRRTKTGKSAPSSVKCEGSAQNFILLQWWVREFLPPDHTVNKKYSKYFVRNYVGLSHCCT